MFSQNNALTHSLSQCKCKRYGDNDGNGGNDNDLYEQNEAENSVDSTK